MKNDIYLDLAIKGGFFALLFGLLYVAVSCCWTTYEINYTPATTTERLASHSNASTPDAAISLGTCEPGENTFCLDGRIQGCTDGDIPNYIILLGGSAR